MRAFDRQPTAMIRCCAVTRLPPSSVTVQRLSVLVEFGRDDIRVQLDVAAQVEAVGDVVRVAQDLGLAGVALGPLPFLLQLVGERIGILHALDVAARARIAVPVPGAADARAALVHARRHAEPAQPMQHVEAGETGADDDRVVDFVCCLGVALRRSASEPESGGILLDFIQLNLLPSLAQFEMGIVGVPYGHCL